LFATPPGVNYCQRVRLMHAAIAHLLLAPSVAIGAPEELGHALAQKQWDEGLGVPLNQEDLAYVLLTFSYVGLRGLAKDKKATFVLASTSECYGDPLVHPQKEDYWGNVNPIGPRGVYDEAKRFAEAMTMAYHRYHEVDTKIVRIFNTYGPRMRLHDGRVVPAFIGEALTGKPLTIFGDGSQTRSFCYVSDLIDGIFRLAMSDFHEPVNIGNPREMTIKQFAEEIIRITGTKAGIEYRPLPEDDPKVR
jgi:dTDP-glucose 4,6-dehydratase